MLITATNKLNYNAVAQSSIYTRRRQEEYKNNLIDETKTKKISQGAILGVCIFIVGLIFCSCAGMLLFKSEITKVQMEVNEINLAIRTIEQASNRLEAEKINAIDIKSIKESAENMGMSLPNSSQVNYIVMNRESNNTNLKYD